jgi:hypothetical protein
MFMQNFSSLACTQTDLDDFLTIFEENSRIFQENSLANSKNFQNWVCKSILDHAKFQLSTLVINRHNLSFYDSWFYFILHRFYVSGVFYGKNSVLHRRRFEPMTVWNHFWHKNTIPHPSVHGYSNSWKVNYVLNFNMNNILDLIDFWKRTGYVLAVVKLTKWFFECSFYPDGLRQIIDHFWRKFQDFSGRLLSEFQRCRRFLDEIRGAASSAVFSARKLKFRLIASFEPTCCTSYSEFWNFGVLLKTQESG